MPASQSQLSQISITPIPLTSSPQAYIAYIAYYIYNIYYIYNSILYMFFPGFSILLIEI